MSKYNGFSKMWFLVLLLVAVVAGCASNPGETVGTAGPVGTTRPTVKSTVPATTTPIQTVLPDTAVTVTFDKDMASGSITAAGAFTVTGPGSALVQGTATPVTYDVASRTATFHPAAALAPGTYIATIKGTGPSAVTDSSTPANALAGNSSLPLEANDYVWSFTTSLTAPVLRPTVISTVPLTTNPGPTLNVSTNTAITATFDKVMDSATITTGTFAVTGTGSALVQGAVIPVTYDAATKTVTFHPLAALTGGVTYTATIKGTGVNAAKDSEGNALAGNPAFPLVANDYVWSFTTASVIVPPPASHLGTAGTYGIMATSTITSTGPSVINGDVALEPGSAMVGFPPAKVNGTTHIIDTVSHQAFIDLLTAYNYYKALPLGVTITADADLGALYPNGIPPGTYTSGSGMSINTHLTLDAGGDPNAVWVFQIGSSLTTTGPSGTISLINGANANNVFWVPTASATIGSGTTFYGTIVAGVSITGQTGALINGRLLAGAIGAGAINLDSNVVNVPK